MWIWRDSALIQAYGHGVYFANESSISMSAYSRASTTKRANADINVEKAAALVELGKPRSHLHTFAAMTALQLTNATVNVPSTFVSSSPYYVVNNVKQIKPFLLLVLGDQEQEQPEAGQASGKLFAHDPALRMKTTYQHQPLRVVGPSACLSTPRLFSFSQSLVLYDIWPRVDPRLCPRNSPRRNSATLHKTTTSTQNSSIRQNPTTHSYPPHKPGSTDFS
jgi:hypothetical protein